MRGINIDRLVQRKRDIVAIKRAVQACRKFCERRLREARDKFLNIADALRSGGRVAGAVAIPE